MCGAPSCCTSGGRDRWRGWSPGLVGGGFAYSLGSDLNMNNNSSNANSNSNKYRWDHVDIDSTATSYKLVELLTRLLFVFVFPRREPVVCIVCVLSNLASKWPFTCRLSKTRSSHYFPSIIKYIYREMKTPQSLN